MGKRSGSRSGIRIRDEQPGHISESLETIFWVKIRNSFMRIRDGKNSDPGSGMNVLDPQYFKKSYIGRHKQRRAGKKYFQKMYLPTISLSSEMISCFLSLRAERLLVAISGLMSWRMLRWFISSTIK
jgi:hypothetical protein